MWKENPKDDAQTSPSVTINVGNRISSGSTEGVKNLLYKLHQ